MQDSSNKFKDGKDRKILDVKYSNFLLDELSKKNDSKLKNSNEEDSCNPNLISKFISSSYPNTSKFYKRNTEKDNKVIKNSANVKKDEIKSKSKIVSPPKHQIDYITHNKNNLKTDNELNDNKNKLENENNSNIHLIYVVYTDSSDNKYINRFKLVFNIAQNEFFDKKGNLEEENFLNFEIFKIPDQIMCIKLFILNISHNGSNLSNNNNHSINNSNSQSRDNQHKTSKTNNRIITIFSCHNSNSNKKYLAFFDVTEFIELKCKENVNKSILNINFLRMVKVNNSIDEFNDNKFIYLISGVSSNVTRYFTLNIKIENDNSVFDITLNETTTAFLDLIFKNNKFSSKDQKCDNKNSNSINNLNFANQNNQFSYNISNNILLVGYHKNYLITYVFNKDKKKYIVRTWLD